LLRDVTENNKDISEINEESFNQHVALAELPAPDLFVRTGGEQRISNFLIWQTAYSELFFVDTLWPDFSEEDLDAALNWYTGRQRRFGKTGQQMAEEASV
jgi:undecaprenyl diphosphate synthase